MELRRHPLMSYKGARNWPPVWKWISGAETTNPQGEVGILQDVTASTVSIDVSCFLLMDYQGAGYMGTLSFDDPSFCNQIYDLLRRNRGREIAYIGGLDVS